MNAIKLYFLPFFATVLLSTSAHSDGKVYVANQNSDTVSVIDVDSLTLIENISVGDVPHNINHTPNGELILVTNKNINIASPPSLSLISSATNQLVGTVENIGSRIEHVVAIDSNTAYVTEDLEHNAVAVIDIDQRRVSRYISVGVKPHGLWPTPGGDALFVPNQLSGTLSKIDVESGTVEAETSIGRTPTMAVVSPDGQFVYVTLYGERGVAVVNARMVESGQLQIYDVIDVGEGPAQVAITPDGNYVLVPCEGPGALYVIDARTRKVVNIINTGDGAHGVDISNDGNLAFVSNRGPGTLSVIDLREGVVLKQIKVGENPAGVDFVGR